MLNNKVVAVVAKMKAINPSIKVFAVNKNGQWTVLNIFMLPVMDTSFSDEIYKEVDDAIESLIEGGHLPFIYQP